MTDPGVSGQAVARANAAGRAAIVGYLPLGWPDLATTRRAAALLAEKVDVLMLGAPTSGATEGSRVSRALQLACHRGIDLEDLTDVASQVAATVPVLVFAYWREIVQQGAATFCRQLAHGGVCGVVTPDLAAEHAEQWVQATDRVRLDRVLPARPGATDEQLALVARHARGWVYVSAIGDDVDEASAADVAARMRRVAPGALVGVDVVGSDREAARTAATRGHAVVAGTTMVEALPAQAGGELSQLAALADEIRAGLAS